MTKTKEINAAMHNHVRCILERAGDWVDYATIRSETGLSIADLTRVLQSLSVNRRIKRFNANKIEYRITQYRWQPEMAPRAIEIYRRRCTSKSSREWKPNLEPASDPISRMRRELARLRTTINRMNPADAALARRRCLELSNALGSADV